MGIRIKSISTLFLVVSLTVTNVLSLTNSFVHGALYGLLEKVTYSSMLKNSPTTRSRAIAKENVKIKKGIVKAKKLSTKVSKRAFRNATKNLASLPAESLPYIGLGTVLALTAMDLRDACETMKDMDALSVALGLSDTSDDTVKICAKEVPGSKYVLSQYQVTKNTYIKMQENLGQFFTDVKSETDGKWNVFYESVGGTIYHIINE